MTRREFHRRAICGAAGLFITTAATGALAQDGSDTKADTSPAQGSGRQTPVAPPPPIPPEGEARPVPDGLPVALAQVRAGAHHLPEEDAEELESQLKGVLDLSRSLRDQGVPDGTEPDFVFRAQPRHPRRRR